MKAIDHENLFKRYQSGEATLEEQAIVEDYILNNEFTPLFLSEAELEVIKVRLGMRIGEIPFASKSDVGMKSSITEDQVVVREEWVVGSRNKFPIWLSSAAAVAAITLGVWFYYASALNGHPGSAQYANDVAPGKNTATLTLADGKVIPLDTNRTNVIVTDSVKTMTMLTASTPRGGTYQVVLPDGTKVWLNADSKISFPSQFIGKERKVLLLNGEAYFEVSKLTRSSLRGRAGASRGNLPERVPFIVETQGSKNRPGQQVEVLGTHFNVNAYEDEGGIKTTLLEGSVKVSSLREGTTNRALRELSAANQSHHAITLEPNQQSVLTDNNRIAMKQVDPEEAVAWKNGRFSFADEDVRSIMKKVARWYDVEVEYDKDFVNQRLVGTISKFENISKVLKMLEMTGTVHFEVAGRRVRVMR